MTRLNQGAVQAQLDQTDAHFFCLFFIRYRYPDTRAFARCRGNFLREGFDAGVLEFGLHFVNAFLRCQRGDLQDNGFG